MAEYLSSAIQNFMKPEKRFVDDLKAIHKGLDVVWSPAMEIFCIYFTNNDGRTFKVYEVVNEDGSFKPFDHRTIELMKNWDIRRSKTSAEKIAGVMYKRFLEKGIKDRQKRLSELKYKSKQLTGFWKRVADQLLEKKFYTEVPVAPIIRAFNRVKELKNLKRIASNKLIVNP